MHFNLFGLIITLLSLLFPYAIKAETVKITTWNMEWLLTATDHHHYTVPTDIPLRTPADFLRLSHVIQTLHSDIFALQEIGSIQAAQKVIPADQYNFFITQDTIAQHPVLAIRKTLTYQIKQNPDLKSLALSSTHHMLRSGLDLTLYKGNITLRILVIHLKSGCQENTLTASKPSCKLLEKQQVVLHEWISHRIKEKQPFLILGDFNRIIAKQDMIFRDLSASSILPTAGFASPCMGGNYFIDGFILDQRNQHWFVKGSLNVMRFSPDYLEPDNGLSDHCPVSIQLSLP